MALKIVGDDSSYGLSDFFVVHVLAFSFADRFIGIGLAVGWLLVGGCAVATAARPIAGAATGSVINSAEGIAPNAADGLETQIKNED